MKWKICIVNVYFGDWPEWFPFFIQSCKANPEFEFILFSDNDPPTTEFVNVRFKNLAVREFNSLVTNKLGFEITIKQPHKICDLKPAFGKIFEDYLSGYDFWGYMDIDLIFGQLNKFISPGLFHQYDIINGYTDYASGPFCILRNNAFVNTLFSIVPEYKEIFSDSKHYCFDEHIIKKENQGYTFRKGLCFATYLLDRIIKGKWKDILFIHECKYKFQWYYKKKSITSPVDFTEVLHKEIREKRIKVAFRNIISSDVAHYRVGMKNWKISYMKGILYDLMEGRQIPVFHFKDVKNNTSFSVEEYMGADEFYITSDGFFYEDI